MAVARIILAVAAVSIALGGCGIKRPLVRPKDIPAYEKKRQERMEKYGRQDDSAPPSVETPQPPTQGGVPIMNPATVTP